MSTKNELADHTIAQLVERLERQLDAQSEWSDRLLAELSTRANPQGPRGALDPAAVAAMAAQYDRLGRAHPKRHELLRVLAADAGNQALETVVSRLIDDPPASGDGAALALAPLFQRRVWPASVVFPRLFAALHESALAAVILDLANYLTRQQRVAEHPGVDRVSTFAELLGRLSLTLGRLEESPQEFALSPQQLTQRVSESLSLVVALCDTLALIGDPSVSGKLHQALELRHRRIQVEAGWALARLHEPRGVEVLVAMAAEPLVRTRALAYLEDVGQLDRAAAEHRTPAAQAAGTLAAWLAEPMRFGIGPLSLELIDQRRQYWPGYDERVECFLFQFEVPLPEANLVGVGIAGPMVYASSVDLSDESAENIYAYYAGLSVEHEAIREQRVEQLTHRERTEWARLKPMLVEAGYQDLQLQGVAQFFEHYYWLAEGRYQGSAGLLVLEGDRPYWYPHRSSVRPLQSDGLYALHKGRVLLETFNTRADDAS